MDFQTKMVKDMSVGRFRIKLWTFVLPPDAFDCLRIFHARDHGLPNLMKTKCGHIQNFCGKYDACCLRTIFMLNSDNSHKMSVTILFTVLYIMFLTYTCRHTFCAQAHYCLHNILLCSCVALCELSVCAVRLVISLCFDCCVFSLPFRFFWTSCKFKSKTTSGSTAS